MPTSTPRRGPRKRYKKAVVIIYRSANGRDGWEPVKPEDVPPWVTHPDNMAKLVDGLECMDTAEGEKGGYWYRGVLPPDELARIDAANAKRARRAERNAKRVIH